MDKIVKIYTDWDGNVVLIAKKDNKRIKKVIKFIPYYWLYDSKYSLYKKITYEYKDRESLNYNDDSVKEADLYPHQLYLIDNEPEFEDTYNILFFDIETKDTAGGIEIGRDRILSICCVDDKGKEYVFCEDDEKSLLTKFRECLHNYDVIVSWNGMKFDLPYVKERFKLYNIYFNFKDINHIDLMKLFMKSYLVQKKLGELSVRSYSLANMAKIFLSEDKLKDDSGEGYGGRLFKLFNENREKLIEYNLQDSKLMKSLNDKLNLLSNQIELSRMCCVNIEDTIYQSIMIDIYTLRKARKLGVHFSSRKRGSEKAHYEGGLCDLSSSGFYTNVVVFDFTSLYPSLIRTFNISPDTLVEDDYRGEYYLTFNNTKFKKERGVIPKIIDELIEYRFKLRDEQHLFNKNTREYLVREIKQVVVKILALSYYGVLGSAFSRYFDLKLARAITLNGQELMKKLIAFTNSLDYCKWIYSDTDAMFISFENFDKVEQYKIVLDEYINKLVKEQTGEDNKYMKMKIEKAFDKFIILSKKKYIGRVVGEEDKNFIKFCNKENYWLYNKGLELVKGDQLIIAKKLMQAIIDEILIKECDTRNLVARLEHGVLPNDDTIKNIFEIVDRYKNKILKGDVEKEDLICVTRVSKMPEEYKTLPAHIKLAIERKKLGDRFYVNMKVNFIIVTNSPLTVIHPSEFVGKFDRIHYWNIKIFNPTCRLLEVIYPGIKWKELYDITLAVQGQKTLFNFKK